MQFLAANKLFVVTNLTPVMEFRRNVADPYLAKKEVEYSTSFFAK